MCTTPVNTANQYLPSHFVIKSLISIATHDVRGCIMGITPGHENLNQPYACRFCELRQMLEGGVHNDRNGNHGNANLPEVQFDMVTRVWVRVGMRLRLFRNYYMEYYEIKTELTTV